MLVLYHGMFSNALSSLNFVKIINYWEFLDGLELKTFLLVRTKLKWMAGCCTCYLESSFQAAGVTSQRSLSIFTAEITPSYILHPHSTAKVKQSKQGSRVQNHFWAACSDNYHKQFPFLLTLLPWTVTLMFHARVRRKEIKYTPFVRASQCVRMPGLQQSCSLEQNSMHFPIPSD